jgi:hypothetical protein
MHDSGQGKESRHAPWERQDTPWTGTPYGYSQEPRQEPGREIPHHPDYTGSHVQPKRSHGRSIGRILAEIGMVIVALIVGAAIGQAGSQSNPSASHTVIKYKTVTVPGPTVTVTQTPSVSPMDEMSGDGVYVVGQDIRKGTWHTTGAVGGSGGNCYYALLSSTDTQSIIDNNNTTGPATIMVGPGVAAVQVSGCNPWTRTGP